VLNSLQRTSGTSAISKTSTLTNTRLSDPPDLGLRLRISGHVCHPHLLLLISDQPLTVVPGQFQPVIRNVPVLTPMQGLRNGVHFAIIREQRMRKLDSLLWLKQYSRAFQNEKSRTEDRPPRRFLRRTKSQNDIGHAYAICYYTSHALLSDIRLTLTP
jgi:hypothetical protein